MQYLYHHTLKWSILINDLTAIVGLMFWEVSNYSLWPMENTNFSLLLFLFSLTSLCKSQLDDYNYDNYNYDQYNYDETNYDEYNYNEEYDYYGQNQNLLAPAPLPIQPPPQPGNYFCNWCSVFRFSFQATPHFYLMNALVYVDIWNLKFEIWHFIIIYLS